MELKQAYSMAFVAVIVSSLVWGIYWSFMKVDEMFCNDSVLLPVGYTVGLTCDYGASAEITPKGQFVCRCGK